MVSDNSEVRGSLVCVGIGMKLGAHISPIAKSYIETADVVFTAISSGIVELWIQEMNPDVRSLQPYYGQGKSRRVTYKEMVEAMLNEVRSGKKVCGAFYGHPGVFAWAPHKSIEQARAEGYQAHMEPGISAEDCLYADLGIDPGKYGCQHFETSQFMFYKRNIDPSAYLILWQVGVAGDKTMKKFSTDKTKIQLLVDLLLQDYPEDHPVYLYESGILSNEAYKADKVLLGELAQATTNICSTLVIPPSKKLEVNHKLLKNLENIDALEEML